MEDIKKDTAAYEEAKENEELLSDGAVDSSLLTLEASLDQCEEKYLRVLAEYDNFRKRSKKEQEGLYSAAFAQGVASFLPVLDNISRAVFQDCSDVQYKDGIILIDKQIKELESKLGIKEFGDIGDVFDPDLHNAVMHIEDESFDDNTICEVFQKGYKIGDRIIRIAMVKVAN